MSYQTWTTYGYGVCVSDYEVPETKVKEFLLQYPEIHNAFLYFVNHPNERYNTISNPYPPTHPKEWEGDINSYSQENLYGFSEDWSGSYCGLASLLAKIIEEETGIPFSACDNFDGEVFLLYEPGYPWNLYEAEKNLTIEQVDDILKKFMRKLTEKEIVVDYYAVHNGS